MKAQLLVEMRSSPPGEVPRRSAAIAVVVILAAVLLPQTILGQKSRKPLTKNEVVGALEGGVPPDQVEELVREFGVAFELTRETEAQLRDAGATDSLIRMIRQSAPKKSTRPARPAVTSPTAPPTTGPPVLVIESAPGGAHVYVDDEPRGTTSSQGRLRLSQLPPGEHTVRVSLTGYQDFEQTVNLAGGQTTRVTASLEAAASPAAPAVPAADQEPAGGLFQTQVPASSGPARLGVSVGPAPQGAKGVTVDTVMPGSPAEHAGLRRGNMILSFAGRSVTSPQELIQLVKSRQPGETVEISYFNGISVQTTRATLAAGSEPAAPQASGQAGLETLGGTAGSEAKAGYAPFSVAHDHGSAGSDYCVGVLAVGNGLLVYRSTNGAHSFEYALSAVKEAKKNSVYLVAIGGFHIRLKKGTNYNFVVINSSGQYQPPDTLLDAIDRAIGKQ